MLQRMLNVEPEHAWEQKYRKLRGEYYCIRDFCDLNTNSVINHFKFILFKLCVQFCGKKYLTIIIILVQNHKSITQGPKIIAKHQN